MYEKGNMYVNAYVRKQFVSASRRCTARCTPQEEVLLEDSSGLLLWGGMYKVTEGTEGGGFGDGPESFGVAGIEEMRGPLTSPQLACLHGSRKSN